jgi:hypothetical protein
MSGPNSGTTGQPKGVAISHTSLIVQSLAKIAVVGYGEDDVCFPGPCTTSTIVLHEDCIALLLTNSIHYLLDCQMISSMVCQCNSFFPQNNENNYEHCIIIGLPAYSSSVPYRRDLFMPGHPDGWRMPCPHS